jgi:TolB-like protein
MSGLVSDATAQRIGQFVGVKTVVYGSFTKVGAGNRVMLRATDVETGQILLIKTYDIRMDGRLAGLLGILDDDPAWAVEIRERALNAQ